MLPVLLTLLLGIISAGAAYSRHIALTNASREASRYGATLTHGSAPGGTTAGWLADVASAAEQAATGDLRPGVPGRRICVAYVHPDGTQTGDVSMMLVRTDSGDVFSTPGANACFPSGDGRPSSERRVQVAVQRTTTIEALVLSQSVTLSARSVTMFEANR